MNISIKEDAVERLAKEIESADNKFAEVCEAFPGFDDGRDLKLMWNGQRYGLEKAFEIVTGMTCLDYWIAKTEEESKQEGA